MDILLENLSWMVLNVLLAFLGIIFGFLFLHSKKFLRILFFILWLLFVPNTIYLVTDIQYLPEQFIKLDFTNQLILVAQYSTIFSVGIITFFLGLYPLERVLVKAKVRDKTLVALIFILLIYLIAFAVALGKFQRVSSWFVITDPQAVIKGILKTVSSLEIIILVLVFGLVINSLYFYSKRIFKLR